MKKAKKNRTIIMAMIGAIIGFMISIVFSKSSNLLAFAPVGLLIGGLVGSIIDNRNNKQ